MEWMVTNVIMYFLHILQVMPQIHNISTIMYYNLLLFRLFTLLAYRASNLGSRFEAGHTNIFSFTFFQPKHSASSVLSLSNSIENAVVPS